MKKSPVHKLKDKLFEQVKKICRERTGCIAAGQGGKRCGGVIQASHIKSEGAWKNLFLDPRNIYGKCYTHHIFWWHKDTTEAAKWFELTYPEDYAYLEKQKFVHYDFNNPFVLERLFSAAKKGYPEYLKEYKKLKPFAPKKT